MSSDGAGEDSSSANDDVYEVDSDDVGSDEAFSSRYMSSSPNRPLIAIRTEPPNDHTGLGALKFEAIAHAIHHAAEENPHSWFFEVLQDAIMDAFFSNLTGEKYDMVAKELPEAHELMQQFRWLYPEYVQKWCNEFTQKPYEECPPFIPPLREQISLIYDMIKLHSATHTAFQTLLVLQQKVFDNFWTSSYRGQDQNMHADGDELILLMDEAMLAICKKTEKKTPDYFSDLLEWVDEMNSHSSYYIRRRNGNKYGSRSIFPRSLQYLREQHVRMTIDILMSKVVAPKIPAELADMVKLHLLLSTKIVNVGEADVWNPSVYPEHCDLECTKDPNSPCWPIFTDSARARIARGEPPLRQRCANKDLILWCAEEKRYVRYHGEMPSADNGNRWFRCGVQPRQDSSDMPIDDNDRYGHIHEGPFQSQKPLKQRRWTSRRYVPRQYSSSSSEYSGHEDDTSSEGDS